MTVSNNPGRRQQDFLKRHLVASISRARPTLMGLAFLQRSQDEVIRIGFKPPSICFVGLAVDNI